MTTLDASLLNETSRLLSGEKVARPAPVRDRYGRLRRDPRGELDWYYSLPETERAYVSRYYMSPLGITCDVLADMVSLDVNAWADAFVSALRASRDRESQNLDVLDDAWSATIAELDDDDQLLGPAEVAELLGVQRNTLAQWRHRGQLPEPDRYLSGMPIWRKGDVLAFAVATDRLLDSLD